MKRKLSITQIFTFILASVFLFTSCHHPVNPPNKTKKDYGTINQCYIDKNGKTNIFYRDDSPEWYGNTTNASCVGINSEPITWMRK